jgi:hypothetical protein
MGWASGSRAMNELIATFNETIGKTDHQIPETAIIDFWKRVISSFEDEDWDTQGESLGEDPTWDKAFFAEHPWDSIRSLSPSLLQPPQPIFLNDRSPLLRAERL